MIHIYILKSCILWTYFCVTMSPQPSVLKYVCVIETPSGIPLLLHRKVLWITAGHTMIPSTQGKFFHRTPHAPDVFRGSAELSTICFPQHCIYFYLVIRDSNPVCWKELPGIQIHKCNLKIILLKWPWSQRWPLIFSSRQEGCLPHIWSPTHLYTVVKLISENSSGCIPTWTGRLFL